MRAHLSVTLLTFVIGTVAGMRAVPAAQPSELSITTLATPATVSQSEAAAINNRGDVVGGVIDDSGLHAMLWTNGVATRLPSLGGDSFALDINDRGEIVGYATTLTGETHAVLWRRNEIFDLGTLPGGTSSSANGINNRGDVVGVSSTALADERHAFVWQHGVMTDLGTLPGGGTYSEAFAINNQGQVVGQSATGSGEIHAVLWDGALQSDLGTLPSDTQSAALDVNSRGQVVGRSLDDFAERAFLFEDGTMTELAGVGPLSTQGNGINDRGWVVGQITTTSSELHAALWINGVVTDLGVLPSGSWSGAADINNRGQVVGSAMERIFSGEEPSDLFRAVLWQ